MQTTIRDLEKYIPEDLVQDICKRSHKLSLTEVHEELRCKHLLSTLLAAHKLNQVRKTTVEMFEGYTTHFMIYIQKNKILLVGYYDDVFRPEKEHTMIVAQGFIKSDLTDLRIIRTFTSRAPNLANKKIESHIVSMMAWTLGVKQTITEKTFQKTRHASTYKLSQSQLKDIQNLIFPKYKRATNTNT